MEPYKLECPVNLETSQLPGCLNHIGIKIQALGGTPVVISTKIFFPVGFSVLV